MSDPDPLFWEPEPLLLEPDESSPSLFEPEPLFPDPDELSVVDGDVANDPVDTVDTTDSPPLPDPEPLVAEPLLPDPEPLFPGPDESSWSSTEPEEGVVPDDEVEPCGRVVADGSPVD